MWTSQISGEGTARHSTRKQRRGQSAKGRSGRRLRACGWRLRVSGRQGVLVVGGGRTRRCIPQRCARSVRYHPLQMRIQDLQWLRGVLQMGPELAALRVMSLDATLHYVLSGGGGGGSALGPGPRMCG